MVLLGHASESDAALTVGASSNRVIPLHWVTETGWAIDLLRGVRLGQAQLEVSAQSVELLQSRVLGVAIEAESAPSVAVCFHLGQVSESAVSSALIIHAAIPLAPVVETSVATLLPVHPMVLVGIVEINNVAGGVVVSRGVTLETAGTGVLEIDTDLFIAPELTVEVLDEVIRRAPTVVTIVVSDGLPTQEAVLSIDGTDVWTTDLDYAGGLAPTSLLLEIDLGGQQGDHEVTVTQQAPYGIVITDSAAYTVQQEPWSQPFVAGVDAQAVEVPGAVSHNTRHWVFQDMLPVGEGGIGSYILPYNPREMTSPHYELTFASRHTTALSGQYHIFQKGSSGMGPKEWTFKGYVPTQEMVAKLEQYRGLNRRFYIIDHRNRAWKCVISDLQVEPRLRHNFNGGLTDWGSDFTITAVVLDQNWVTPA